MDRKSRVVLVGIVLMCALMTTFNVAMATSTTYALVKATYNSVVLYEKSFTLVGATDVAICTFTGRVPTGGTTFGELLILISKKNATDTLNLQVRFEYSYDGTNYGSVTVGTDSTTWATAGASYISSTYSVNRVSLASATYPDAPYKRVKITNATNRGCDTVAFKVAFIPS